jgi:hypothetical protein
MKYVVTIVSSFLLAGHTYAEDSSATAMAVLKKMITNLESAQTTTIQAVATAADIESTEDFKLHRTFQVSSDSEISELFSYLTQQKSR